VASEALAYGENERLWRKLSLAGGSIMKMKEKRSSLGICMSGFNGAKQAVQNMRQPGGKSGWLAMKAQSVASESWP